MAGAAPELGGSYGAQATGKALNRAGCMGQPSIIGRSSYLGTQWACKFWEAFRETPAVETRPKASGGHKVTWGADASTK